MADITVVAATVAWASGAIQSGTAGETITAGMPVYLKTSDSRLWKAQCDGTAAEAAAVGISLHASLAGQPLAYAGNGSVINIGGTTAKTVYVVSAAAGAVAPIADLVTGNYITRLGHASGTSGSVFTVDINATGVTAS
jgi:hypothetical protein